MCILRQITGISMKIKDITQLLEAWAPLPLQESYDNAGLLTGNKEDELTGVLLCLDSTEAVIDEAIQKKCNLVVAHHPLVFSGLKKFTGSGYVERTLIKAIRHHIAIYAIHTNLDNVNHGVNFQIARKLGLVNTRILSPKKGLLKKLVTFCPQAQAAQVREAVCAAGAGHIGAYDACTFNAEGYGTFRAGEQANPFVGKTGELHTEPEVRIETIFPAHQQRAVIKALVDAHPYEEPAYDIYALENDWNQTGAGMIGELPQPLAGQAFLEHLKTSMQLQVIRHTALLPGAVKTVAVCGGSGSFVLGDAIRQGADVLVTADFKYHQFFDAENKIVIADIGHYESEIFTVSLLGEQIQKKFPTFVPIFSEIVTNPVNYYY